MATPKDRLRALPRAQAAKKQRRRLQRRPPRLEVVLGVQTEELPGLDEQSATNLLLVTLRAAARVKPQRAEWAWRRSELQMIWRPKTPRGALGIATRLAQHLAPRRTAWSVKIRRS